jgi:putative flippase GtrA
LANHNRRQLLHFTLIGGIGFVIDGGALTLLSVMAGVNLYFARLISFTLATLTTWWLNRRHTFGMASAVESGAKASEYGRYLLIQIGGGLINLTVFAWLIFIESRLRAIPVLPLAIGAVAGLVWNFLGAKLWVYKT